MLYQICLTMRSITIILLEVYRRLILGGFSFSCLASASVSDSVYVPVSIAPSDSVS